MERPAVLWLQGVAINAIAPVQAGTLRCVIYTRKSSEEGLEQSFNSLHAQRDACEAYIRSQAGEGWTALPTQYDDGGVSGGTMERPALKQLLADVAAGRIDVVVVYKVDRLTRTLGDFAKIVEIFDKAGASFVSVTQAFNTTTSMGRLTLNVLLSFAQFEREVTGERIRDKIALSKAKGLWMGGVTALGYDKGDHVLVVNEAEAETVCHIFRRYLELGSVHVLAAELKKEGTRSKRWTTTAGKTVGGAVLRRGALFHLLRNRHYLGEIIHKDETYPGLHPAIIDKDLFDPVQTKLAANTAEPRKRRVKRASALLTRLIFDGEGRRFSPTFSSAGRNGRLHRYYVLADIQQGKEDLQHPDSIRRIGADALEAFVLTTLRRLTDGPALGTEELRALLRRIEARPADTHLLLDPGALAVGNHPDLALQDLESRLHPGERMVQDGDLIRIALPRRMKLRGGKTWATFRADPVRKASIDRTLVDGLRRAHILVADWKHEERSLYRRRLRRLAFLSPTIQRMILGDGSHRGWGSPSFSRRTRRCAGQNKANGSKGSPQPQHHEGSVGHVYGVARGTISFSPTPRVERGGK